MSIWSRLVQLFSSGDRERYFAPGGESVQIMGFSSFLYRDGRREMVVGGEMMASGNVVMVLYLQSIRSWSPPFEDEPVTDEERAMIAENIRAALASSGIVIAIE